MYKQIVVNQCNRIHDYIYLKFWKGKSSPHQQKADQGLPWVRKLGGKDQLYGGIRAIFGMREIASYPDCSDSEMGKHIHQNSGHFIFVLIISNNADF